MLVCMRKLLLTLPWLTSVRSASETARERQTVHARGGMLAARQSGPSWGSGDSCEADAPRGVVVSGRSGTRIGSGVAGSGGRGGSAAAVRMWQRLAGHAADSDPAVPGASPWPGRWSACRQRSPHRARPRPTGLFARSPGWGLPAAWSGRGRCRSLRTTRASWRRGACLQRGRSVAGAAAACPRRAGARRGARDRGRSRALRG